MTKRAILFGLIIAAITMQSCDIFESETDDDNEHLRDTTRVLDDLCFERDVLPILLANCATSGCHDAATASHGIILDSYSSVMTHRPGLVKPYDPWDSELWEVLVEDEADERMPPAPRQLTGFQIDVIRQWIQDGARNDVCSDTGACDTSAVTWAQVRPILESRCWSCHSNSAAAANVKLEVYADVTAKVADGSLIPSIERIPPRTPMPPNAPLTECEVATIKAWASQGLRP